MKYSKCKNMGKKQSGFTLIELLMVVVILGILAYVSMSAFSGSPNAANATAIRGGATEIAKGVGYIHANLGNGIKTTAGNNKLLGAGSTMLDVLIIGNGAITSSDAVMKKNFDALSMRPLESEFRVVERGDAATAGKYTLLNYPVTVNDSTCPPAKVCVDFAEVPDEVRDEILTRYGLSGQAAVTVFATTQTTPVAYMATKVGTNNTNTVRFALIP